MQILPIKEQFYLLQSFLSTSNVLRFFVSIIGLQDQLLNRKKNGKLLSSAGWYFLSL